MIHQTAIIDSKAEIDSDVVIGPHVCIGPNVKIHKKVEIQHHANIDGYTEIGSEVKIFPYASVGSIPQDLKYHGEESFCKIGAKTVIREFVTINSGAPCNGMITQTGENCLLMAYSHLGHNATIGNNVIIANAGTLAGHVFIDDYAIVGGLVGIHQFVKIGKMVIIGGCSKIVKDIPPFMLVDGNPALIRSINTVGLQRKGFSPAAISKIKETFKILFKRGFNMTQALKELEAMRDSSEVNEIVGFIQNSERGITKGGK